jgi:Ca-activated chloride channel family protein
MTADRRQPRPLSPTELVALVERAGELGCTEKGRSDEGQEGERQIARSRNVPPPGLLAAIEAEIPGALGARSDAPPMRTPWHSPLARAPVRSLAIAAAVLVALSAALLSFARWASTRAATGEERDLATVAVSRPEADLAELEIGATATTSSPDAKTGQPFGMPDDDDGASLARGSSPRASDGTPAAVGVGATNDRAQEPSTRDARAHRPAAPRVTAADRSNDFRASGRSPERSSSSEQLAERPTRVGAQRHGATPRVFVDPWLSSFPLEVASESYLRARRALASQRLPSPESVRVEEFLNAFDYDDPQPSDGDFELTAEGAPSPFDERLHLLRFGISARALDASARSPVHLTLVVETPSNRAGQRNYELMRPALELLFERLAPSDSVALVVFGATARTLVRPTSDFDHVRGRLRQAFAFAIPGGSAAPEEGVRLGYELALQSLYASKTNRVVLCYDRRSPFQEAVAAPLRRTIEEARSRGIGFSAVGFDGGASLAGGADVGTIEELATLGGGPSVYVHTPRQASHRLIEALLDRRQLVAREALARVRFDREKVRSFRLLASSTGAAAAPAGAPPLHGAVESAFDSTLGGALGSALGSAELAAGISVTALYELELARPVGPRESLATLSLRYVAPGTGVVHETSHRVLGRDLADTWQSAPPSLRLGTVAVELAASLGERHLLPASPAMLHQQSRQLLLDYPQRGDVRELTDLVASAQRLRIERRAPGG